MRLVILFTRITWAVLISLNVFAQSPTQNFQILAYGDSITAGYGLAKDQSYPKQLEKKLNEKGFNASVTNGGVSGDTSTQALSRVNWALKGKKFSIVLLCIGANDGLRLQPPSLLQSNLSKLVDAFQQHGAKVVLLGMKLPTNLDATYRRNFERVYTNTAKQKKIPLIPFFLEGIATQTNLNQEDQIHPNVQGAELMASNLVPALESLIRQLPR
jgi:acyl-CoA thioesterase-1